MEKWTAQAWSKELLSAYPKEDILRAIGELASSKSNEKPNLNSIANSIQVMKYKPASHEIKKAPSYKKPSGQRRKFDLELMRMIDHCMDLPTKNLRGRKFKALAEWGMKKAKEMELAPSAIREWENTIKAFNETYD